jgi:putative radical SAM enzyme (TIGR03279 family)
MPEAPENRPAGVRVEAVESGSPAERAGIRRGDHLVSVSGKAVGDLLDLFYLTGKSRYSIAWSDRAGKPRSANFRTEGEPLGVFPEPVRVRRCRNRCIFCFVHQLPKGMRKALYVKDEDVRLSFLHGQYVTLSDVTDEEMSRILRYRLSPLYVSIHTTDAALRRRMLANPAAADILDVMRRLIRGGISLHGQIVVCPGINDGEELERTLAGLLPLRPGLSTVAVVPVGLTAHRKGLPALRPVTPSEAIRTLRIVEEYRTEAGENGGEPFVMAADEYYLLAGRKPPSARAYGSFAQIENGVGLLRRFQDESRSLFRRARWKTGAGGGTVVSGLSARGVVGPFLARFSERSGSAFLHLPVENRLMGRSVTVTGLVSGGDILAALGRRKPSRLYVPSVMLRDAGDLFLDGMSPSALAREIHAEVILFDPTPFGFAEAVLGENRESFR